MRTFSQLYLDYSCETWSEWNSPSSRKSSTRKTTVITINRAEKRCRSFGAIKGSRINRERMWSEFDDNDRLLNVIELAQIKLDSDSVLFWESYICTYVILSTEVKRKLWEREWMEFVQRNIIQKYIRIIEESKRNYKCRYRHTEIHIAHTKIRAFRLLQNTETRRSKTGLEKTVLRTE